MEPRTFQQTEAYYRVFQDWGGWMREGILDWSIPMVYKSQHVASHRVQFAEWLEFTKMAQYARHGVIGLGSFMNSLENTILQIEAARAPAMDGSQTRGLNFFSYNATNQAITGVPLRARDEFFRALSEDDAYAAEAPFSTSTTVPMMTWKTAPRNGHLLAEILGANGAPADGARIIIQKVSSGPADEMIVQYADGNGYVGGVDLTPGVYQLVIGMPAMLDERVTVPNPIVPGRVTRLRIALGSPSRGPIVRSARILGAHERIDHLTEASPLEEWQGREPVPEDIAASRIPPQE